MKKFLLIILSTFYLVISVGFINYNVYCQDKLIKTTITMNSSLCEQCPDCIQKDCPKDGSCCNHAKEHVQLKTDQTSYYQNINLTPQEFIILDLFLLGYIIPKADIIKESYPTNLLQERSQNPIHILNCTYLI